MMLTELGRGDRKRENENKWKKEREKITQRGREGT